PLRPHPPRHQGPQHLRQRERGVGAWRLRLAYEKGGDRFTEADQTLFSKDWRPYWVAGRKPEDFERTVDVFGLAKVIHYMITGLKVPASQIDEPHADIRKLYPGAPGVDQVHDLLAG